MERVDELIEIIANGLSKVGSNMGMIERGADMLNMRQSLYGNAISRVNEVSVAEDSFNLSRSDILINSNLMMRVQASAIQQDVTLTLIS
jgi:flagellin-like hook-associated protein FlgL